MRRGGILALTATLCLASGLRAAGPQRAASPAADAIVKQYCVTCHNARLNTAGLALDAVNTIDLPAHAETWEKVVRKLRAGAMPPPGTRRPDQGVVDQLASYLEGELDRHGAQHPSPGRPLLHRLNRTEYANAIRDLLAVNVGDVASLLPPDDSAFGFDNVSDVLGTSPLLLERYLDVAGKVSAIAVGNATIGTGSETYRVRQDLSQNQHIDGLPFGTVGGLRVEHMFPLDGQYVFQVKMFRNNVSSMRGLETQHRLEVAVDGERVHLTSMGGNDDLLAFFPEVLPNGTAGVNRAPIFGDALEANRLKIRIPVKAGPRTVTVAFLDESPLADTKPLQSFQRSSSDTYDWSGHPHIEMLSITGPFEATGSGDTPSRRRIFQCRPETRAEEDPCAKSILTRLGTLAYRQPLTDVDIARLMQFYQRERREGTFETGIETALQRMLASPKFVFRAEAVPANAAAGTVYRISDLELASRLSFFLWSSIPDEPLLRLAADGTLKDPAVLDQQVRRMLADARSSELVSNFAGQWLQLRNLRTVIPDNDEFPDFDDNLRQAFEREVELLFDSVIREDRSVVDLLTADYTFVNERLARHYGMPKIYGSQFRRVTLTDDARRGLLGKGSVLMVTSYANRTSPVKRGKWILENILGMPPPPPPPDVPSLKEKTDSGQPRTIREQMEEHRRDPGCASCHKQMDPLGFALENFDAVGAWRVKADGARIDASSQLFDGAAVDGVVSLRQALMKRPELFVQTLTEKLLTYGLGRGLDYHDMPAVRGIVRDTSGRNYRFSALITSIVRSDAFQKATKGQEDL